MGQALYRKYRSKSLDELVGQEHITATLKNALKSGRISHAYLLTGPRGSGKTSIARILAHEINGLPYTDETPLDIIEIDAASNRRIDEIRDLRDRVNTAPSSAKYKVYIIDEVHMLTREAFNALLKTLEEPPAHVVFILATTEAHKLPETIISRTQRYTFRPVPRELVVAHLKSIAKAEKITIDDDALELIAEHGEGAFRDSISLLDQASSVSEKVTRADIERMLGLAPAQQISTLHDALLSGNGGQVVTALSDIYGAGYEPAAVAAQLSAVLRAQVLAGAAESQQLLTLLARLLSIPGSRNPRQLLEITLLQSTLPAAPLVISAPQAQVAVATQSTTQPAAIAQPAATPHAPAPKPTVAAAAKVPAAAPAPAKPTPKAAATAAVAPAPAVPTVTAATFDATTGDVVELWQKSLNTIKSQYNTLYGIARMAKPQIDGTRLILGFKFAFHQKRINESKNRKIFADVVEQLYGSPLEIICVLIETDAPAADVTSEPADVSAISNIFGGAELLES